MPDTGFEANDAFFDALGRDPGVVALCRQAADRILSNAVTSAPVASGDYKKALHVDGRSAAYRETFRVVADADDSMIVEAHTGNLARAMRGVRV